MLRFTTRRVLMACFTAEQIALAARGAGPGVPGVVSPMLVA